MHVAIIGGASTIGATTAYALCSYRQDIDVTLVDIDEDAAVAHATDLTHAAYHFARGPNAGANNPEGQIRGIHPDDIEQIDPDVAIVSAGGPGGPSEDENNLDRSFRSTTIDSLVHILDDIIGQLDAIGPLPVINVTNPLDRVTYYLWAQLGWDQGTVFGYSLSESARAAEAIGRSKGVHPTRVTCPTMGEHGEELVLVFSQATIDGEPVDFTDAEREEIYDYVQDIPMEIAKGRGIEDSSRWVTSAGILRLLRLIEADTQSEPVCLSVPLDGEYGVDRGCFSVPVRLDETGVSEIIEWELTPSEHSQLMRAHDAISETLPDVSP